MHKDWEIINDWNQDGSHTTASLVGLGFLSTRLLLYQVHLQLLKAPPPRPQCGSFCVTSRSWERSCEWWNEQPSARRAPHIMVYLQVTLVPINQLKPTSVYVTWQNTWRKSTGSLVVTGITLLGVSYKNMAQLYPPRVSVSFNHRRIKCRSSPTATLSMWRCACCTHALQHITQHQTSNSHISVALKISPIYNTARKPLLCVKTMYILELTEFTNQYETRYVIYIKNICLDGVPSFRTTHWTVQISTVMLNCALKTVKLWLTDYNYWKIWQVTLGYCHALPNITQSVHKN